MDSQVTPRILHVEQNEDGTVGGSHRILADLVLRGSPTFEHVVLFHQDNVWADRLRAAGVEVHTWDDRRAIERARPRRGRVGTAIGLASQIGFRLRFLREARIDAVHLNNAPFVGADVWIPACRIARVPCMTYAMGFGPGESAVQRWFQRRFDLVFSLSEVVERDLDAIGIDPSRRVLTYPGIDLEAERGRVTRTPQETRRALGVPEGDVAAVMVGNIREWKGQAVVLDAVSRLPSDLRARLSLFLVGDEGSSPDTAAYGQRLRDDIRRLGLEETVSLTGRRDDVPDLFAAADIAIHASIIPEPFGLVVLEAMAHGCAILAADSGGPVEMLTPDSGVMFDTRNPAQATGLLADLMTDPDRRAALGSNARRRAGEFDLERHVRLVEDGYRRVLSS